MSREVTTSHACDRCSETVLAYGVKEYLPTGWRRLELRPIDGRPSPPRELNMDLCSDCRRSLHKWTVRQNRGRR